MALTTSEIRTTVFGDLRVVIGKLTDVTTTGDEFDTGLEWVYYCSIVDIEDDEALQIVLNADDSATEGENPGYVWAQLYNGTDDCMFFAIGK